MSETDSKNDQLKLYGMIGVVQLCVKNNPLKNLTQLCEPLIVEAKHKGCELICLPEAFDFLGVPGTGDGARLASFLDGDLMKRYCSIARRENVWLSLGGFHERLKPDDITTEHPQTFSNTHVIIDNSGSIVARYRKIHMFDTDYDGGYRESQSTRRGEELVVVNTPVGKIGLTVCYDLRFPLIFNRLAKAGCDLILVPSAFMPTTGKAHWHTLLKARAIENQCYIAAAAQVGEHNKKRRSYGHSLIIDPWGDILCDLGENPSSVGTALIDKIKLENIKKNMPMFNQPDVSAMPLSILGITEKN